MKNEEKQEFSSEYCDDLLVEVLESGKQLVQSMADNSLIFEVGQLEYITRFANVILKAKEYAHPSSIAVACKDK
ncbi:hypothetical protein [Lactococcus sp. DD01]|uniref:hypothetical protein n=1 Tax=Lactococcus sp. DD01 TaxID=1776443 RepID=UPI0007768F19|nr:hypothetical protein [Lactococcus sp. DD01]KXT63135.1 hypothetical protein LACDD01_00162 [Lactococcus sp. DD01]